MTNSEYNEGFRNGWKARGEYIQDYRKAHNGTAGGIGLMLISSMFSIGMIVVAFFVIGIEHVNIANFIKLEIGCWVVFALAVWLHRWETRDYQKRQNDFNKKWIDETAGVS